MLITMAVVTNLAMTASAPLTEPSGALHAEQGKDVELIRGIVKAVTEKELTVGDVVDETKETKFRLTAETKYFKDGKEAKLGDVTAGANVAVKATKAAEGRLDAVEVEISKNSQSGH
jgi:hypothetical protein